MKVKDLRELQGTLFQLTDPKWDEVEVVVRVGDRLFPVEYIGVSADRITVKAGEPQ